MPKGRKSKKRKHSASIQSLSPSERKQANFKKNKKYILPLVINTILFFGVYSVLVRQSKGIMMATLWTYFALTIIFSFSYIIYNRGFSRMSVTPEMLPASMSAEEKEEFIENGKVRLEKSKWMLLIIFPLLMTFIFDIVGIFLLEPIIEFANSIV